ncbi:MAG TPA: carbamoyltransferase HypF [Acidimicrobiales bacterium]|jgi:hydrogenase maturation protein HypF|nr:carbamoyltransferase HypF [Acidimicrobiales bacterium]
MTDTSTEPVQRWQLRVTGTVQGVGFRPFVYHHAVRLGLGGFVRNDSAGVLIEVEGLEAAVAELGRLLVDDAPPLARVTGVTVVPLTVVPDGGVTPPSKAIGAARFVIARSADDGHPDVPVSIDTGPCEDCLAEVNDPADRRYGYAFTNCTNCGPRYTLVVSVPYDRPATTMAAFIMCPACQHEYDDPADRRFHAQPNACPACGPHLELRGPGGAPWSGWGGATGGAGPVADHAVAQAAAALRSGAILAIKGVGGYHLAVDATSSPAVTELRRRKSRDDKPFAVMVPNGDSARQLVELTDAGMALLASPRRPIVVAPRRTPSAVAPGVAPGLAELGVMLPYSPLHQLLLTTVGQPLVMTSGNVSDEPIAYTDDDAVDRLGPMVDGIVTHDRPIHIRCDDSVVRARGDVTQVLRRSRGYAPEPIYLSAPAAHAVLAVGAELKSTVSVVKGSTVVASHHLGDLEHPATYRAFLQAIDHMCHLGGVTPEMVAHDLHPEYLSTKLATELELPTVPVQHHHAHVASCLVDHGRTGPVLGIAFDGLGYGTDETLWGGEFLVADLVDCERVGHLAPMVLPGGTAAIRQPWRMAVAWLLDSCGPALAADLGGGLDRRADTLVRLLGGPRTSMPVTTSVGRLFDAVGAIVCERSSVSYEGQAAIELEALAAQVPPGAMAPYPVGRSARDGRLVMEPSPMVAAVAADRVGGRPPPEIAAAFHEGVAAATVAAGVDLATMRGLSSVVLTGGVFQNARLSGLVEAGLQEHGLEVLVHRTVPPNDGGISIGQAAIAVARAAG